MFNKMQCKFPIDCAIELYIVFAYLFSPRRERNTNDTTSPHGRAANHFFLCITV